MRALATRGPAATLAYNADYVQGLASSVRIGLAALGLGWTASRHGAGGSAADRSRRPGGAHGSLREPGTAVMCWYRKSRAHAAIP